MTKKSKNYALIITEQCNANCVYCYAQKGKGKKMNWQTASALCHYLKKDILKNDIRQAGIIFQGNEPLLNFKILKAICEKLIADFSKDNKRKLSFVVFTNLTAMDKQIFTWLKKRRFYVHVSLDGPRELHDKQRGKGSFKKTVFWLGKIIKNDLPLTVAAVITRFSLKKWREIVDTYKKLGIGVINLRVLHPIGLGKKNWQSYNYSPGEYLYFRKKIFSYICDINKKGSILVDQKALFLFLKVRNKGKNMPTTSPPCSAIKGQICIGPGGDIYTCDEGRSGGDIFRIGDLWRGINPARAKNFLNWVKLAGKKNCLLKNCPINNYCGTCLALNDPLLANNQFRCVIFRGELKYFSDLFNDKRMVSLFRYWEREQYDFLHW
jgi:radical SAM protein with 4Fe4S-binding SPASM domain